MEGGKKHPNRLAILALNTMFTEGTDEASQAQRASVTQQLWLARGGNATSTNFCPLSSPRYNALLTGFSKLPLSCSRMTYCLFEKESYFTNDLVTVEDCPANGTVRSPTWV